MHLIKVAFLLSFLAICLRPQAEAGLGARLNKYLICAEVVTDSVAKLLENSVSGLKVMADCVDFKPELKLNGSLIRFLRLAYQFIHKILVEKQSCLISLLTSAVTLVRPSINEFDQLNCLNPEVQNDI